MVGVKQFCVDEALDKALFVFWQKGYEATSVRDLLENMGIQKGSFYATFSSKRDVYIKALRQYCLKTTTAIRQMLLDADSPKDALRGLLQSKVAGCSTMAGKLGCMGVNAAMEMAPTDSEVAELMQKFFLQEEKILQETIEKAQKLGQISSSVEAEAAAKAIFSILMGMNILGRAQVSAEHQTSIVGQAMRLLEA